MAKRELVDVQLLHEGTPVGDRYKSEVDHTSAGEVHGLYRDALTHAGIPVPDGRGTWAYAIKLWRHDTGAELFTYTY